MSMLEHKNMLTLLEELVRLAAEGAPVCCAVCDSVGTELGFLRMDNTPARSVLLAKNKAYTAARMGLSTRAFHARLEHDRYLAADFGDARFTPIVGGVPLLDATGCCVGGLGISGRSLEEDEALALALAAYLAAYSIHLDKNQ